MGQSYTCLDYHFVFSTAERREQIKPDFQVRLYDYMAGILAELDSQARIINGMPDHVHVLARIHPSHSVADVLRVLKTNSSLWVHKTLRREFT
jgi:putative transposase